MADKKRKMIRSKDTSFEKIQAFYIDPDQYPLTPTQESIRQRWVKVVSLRLKGYPKFKIANMLVKDEGLNISQAYRDIKSAETIFGDVYKTDREVEKLMWKDWILDLRRRSRKFGNIKAELKAADLFAKYGDFDKDDLIFNPEKLEKVEIEVRIAPELEPFLKEAIASGVVDFNRLNVTDAEFEDVSNEQ